MSELTEDEREVIWLCPEMLYNYNPSQRSYDERWVFAERGEVRGEQAALRMAGERWDVLIEKMANNQVLAARMALALAERTRGGDNDGSTTAAADAVRRRRQDCS